MFNYFEEIQHCPLDKDALGKIVFRTFLKKIAKVPDRDLDIDIERKGENGFPGDVRFRVYNTSFEVKTSSLLEHVTQGWNWAFSKTRLTDKKKLKSPFDFLFCVGLPPVGHQIHAQPTDESYLTNCGFFIVPYSEIRGKNQFRTYLKTLPRQPYLKFFAEGRHVESCKALWSETLVLMKRNQPNRLEPTSPSPFHFFKSSK